jgi:hypothetical protein
MMIFRHGDVLLQQIEKIDQHVRESAKTEDAQRGIVQRGESTGHAHVIDLADPGVEVFETWREKFIAAERSFTISHEEHKPLTLPPGNYRVKIAREFDYVQHASRMVVD